MTDAQHSAVSAPPDTALPEAVLFDMDGLLVDSEPLWFEVETDVMTRLGGTWTAADQQALVAFLKTLPDAQFATAAP